jgi:integrase
MRIYRRGKVYWYELIFRGERFQRSSGSKNRRLAGELASAFHTSLLKGEAGIVERKKPPALDVAMKAFLAWSKLEHAASPLTAKRSVTSSRPLLKHFGKISLDRISAQDVEAYKQARSAQLARGTTRKVKPATVNRELACLREMFNHAIKGHPDLRNPVSKVKFLAENSQKDRVLTYAEQRAYLAAATDTLFDVATIILETGMRPEEVYTLRTSQIHLDRGFLQVVKGKTKAARRRIELTAECRRVLAERVERARSARPGTGLLFPCETDPQRPIPKVSNAHERAVRDSGVPRFVPYDLRHTWATRAAESGVDLVTLAAMMGHSRIQMVLRYAHPTQTHQTSATRLLEAYNARREAEEQRLGVPDPKLYLRRPA